MPTPLKNKKEFIEACQKLVVKGDLSQALCDKLSQWELFEDLGDEVLLEGLTTSLKVGDLQLLITNVDDKVELNDEDNTIIDEIRMTVKAAKERRFEIASLGGLHGMLIEIMAASSEIGAGNEESVAMVEGAPQIATMLAQNEVWRKQLKVLANIYKNEAAMLLPYHFMLGVLLSKKEKESLVNKQFPQNLAKDIEGFQKEQKYKFGDCLAKGAQEARATFLSMTSDLNSDAYDLFSSSVPLSEKNIEDLRALSDRVKEIIQERIDSSHGLHVNLAKAWLQERKGPRSVSPFFSRSQEFKAIDEAVESKESKVSTPTRKLG